ncbi:MAG: LysR family transcriptional regulator, partial [Lachnospiraceae bacterium]|nr:LysR family transcriptional regulator [Lachnospiraceae bacterium]
MINYIKLIIEEGSITDAAKKLNISQPALSAKVKKIEEDYG